MRAKLRHVRHHAARVLFGERHFGERAFIWTSAFVLGFLYSTTWVQMIDHPSWPRWAEVAAFTVLVGILYMAVTARRKGDPK